MAANAMQWSAIHQRNLSRLTEQASSGLRINRPSDDPVAIRSVYSSRSIDRRLEAQLVNLGDARARLNTTVSLLTQAKDIFVQAQSLAADARSSDDRDILAAGVDGLIERLAAIANETFEGDFRFGGTAIDRPPFSFGKNRSDAVYTGSTSRSNVLVAKDQGVDVYYRGDEIFMNRQRATTTYLGNTGARSGIGTDTGVGRGQLVIDQTATSYQSGSGIAAGSKAVGGDTVIGPAGTHQLRIQDTSGTGESGTISLNGGPAVGFTNTTDNLLVGGPNGELVYLNTTSIVPGFSGTVDITADGTISADGGTTVVPLDFSAAEDDMQLIGLDDEAVHVRFRDIRQAGTETLVFGGTASAFDVLVGLRNELRAADSEVDEAAFQESLTNRIDDLDRFTQHFLAIVGQQASALENLDHLQARHEDVQIEVKRVLGELESADLAQIIIDMQAEQNLLQFTYAATARMFDQNLLNFFG